MTSYEADAGAAAASGQAVAVGSGLGPEPALRPAARRSPGLDVARTARVFRNGRTLVVRERDGSERRFAVGQDTADAGAGIRRAVHLDMAGDCEDGSMANPPRPGGWGYVDLQNADGRRVLRIDPEDWLPEAAALAYDRPRGPVQLELTGISGLLKDLGVPVHTVRDPADPLLAHSESGRGTDLRPGRLLPRWNTLGRGAATAVWFVALAAAIFPVGDPPASSGRWRRGPRCSYRR